MGIKILNESDKQKWNNLCTNRSLANTLRRVQILLLPSTERGILCLRLYSMKCFILQ